MNRAFRRDRLTWLAYLMLAYYAYVMSVFGPIMPFLRSELALNYTVGGLHLTAFASGMILTGILGNHLSHRLGRRYLLWAASLGIALGGLALALGRQASITLFSALCMGVFGSLIQFVVQAILADHHGERRAVALTEANIGAGLSGALAPFLVSGFAQWGLSWRWILVLVSVFLAALALVFLRTAIPDGTRSEGQSAGAPGKKALPLMYWGFWLAVILFVAIEWCLLVWGAEIMIARFDFSKEHAAAVMGFYLGVGVLSRVVISHLARKVAASSLLSGSLILCLAGFLIFWIATGSLLSACGLLLAGMGVTNLFPLAMTLAVGSAPNQADLASARLAIAIGLAGLSAPLGLGWLADQVGLQRASAAIVVFLAAGLLLTFILRQKSLQ